MIFILDSEKELYQKSVNCNGTQMSLKRFNDETSLEFVFTEPEEHRAQITLSDEELRVLHRKVYRAGFSVCESTQLSLSLTPADGEWRLAFMFAGMQEDKVIKVYLSEDELRYLQILLTEKL